MDLATYVLFNNNGHGDELTPLEGKMIIATFIGVVILALIMVVVELIRGNRLKDILLIKDGVLYLTELLLIFTYMLSIFAILVIMIMQIIKFL